MKDEHKIGDIVTFRNIAHYPSLTGKPCKIVAVHDETDDWHYRYSVQFLHDNKRMCVNWSEVY